MLAIDVLHDEAQDLRDILHPRMSLGIRVQERRRWWLWTRFTVTGPEQALQAVRVAVSDWRDAKIIENAL